MNLSNEQIKAILTVAQTLQRNYDILGAPATQNVRNPYPMHKLVIGALPTRKTRRMTAEEIQTKLTEYGYRVPKLGLAEALTKLCKRGAIESDELTPAQRTSLNLSRAGKVGGRRRLAYWYPSGS